MTGETVLFSNPPTASSGANASAGRIVSPSRSRTVVLYSTFVSRRSGTRAATTSALTAVARPYMCDGLLYTLDGGLLAAPQPATSKTAKLAARPCQRLETGGRTTRRA